MSNNSKYLGYFMGVSGIVISYLLFGVASFGSSDGTFYGTVLHTILYLPPALIAILSIFLFKNTKNKKILYLKFIAASMLCLATLVPASIVVLAGYFNNDGNILEAIRQDIIWFLGFLPLTFIFARVASIYRREIKEIYE